MKGTSLPYPPDEVLLQRISGEEDTNAFNTLYNRYSELVLRWALHLTHNKEASKDISQTVWIKLWKDASVFKTDEDGCLMSYLAKTVTYQTLSYLKSAQARSEGVSEEQWEVLANKMGYTHIIEEASFEDLKSMVKATLDGLPELTRRVFDCRWYRHMTTKETAEALGISEKKVKKRFKDARNQLQDGLGVMLSPEAVCLVLILIQNS